MPHEKKSEWVISCSGGVAGVMTPSDVSGVPFHTIQWFFPTPPPPSTMAAFTSDTTWCIELTKPSSSSKRSMLMLPSWTLSNIASFGTRETQSIPRTAASFLALISWCESVARCRSADESLRRLKFPHSRRWYLLGSLRQAERGCPLCTVAGGTESFPLGHICPRAAAVPDFSRPRKCTAQGYVSRVGWLSPSRDLGNLF